MEPFRPVSMATIPSTNRHDNRNNGQDAYFAKRALGVGYARVTPIFAQPRSSQGCRCLDGLNSSEEMQQAIHDDETREKWVSDILDRSRILRFLQYLSTPASSAALAGDSRCATVRGS
jgi:hypothetical protein